MKNCYSNSRSSSSRSSSGSGSISAKGTDHVIEQVSKKELRIGEVRVFIGDDDDDNIDIMSINHSGSSRCALKDNATSTSSSLEGYNESTTVQVK